MTPPPNAHCVASESVVPRGQPAFRWAVFATDDPPDDVIAFYTRSLGRAPDEAGHTWREPLQSVSVYPIEQVGEVPLSATARTRIPAAARTLVFQVQKSRAAPPREPYQDNVFPESLSPAMLLAATLAGRLVWAASEKGPVLKAGGRATGGPLAGRELWVTVGRVGREFQLAVTAGMSPCGEPVRQRSGWFRRCELADLWAAARRTAGEPEGEHP